MSNRSIRAVIAILFIALPAALRAQRLGDEAQIAFIENRGQIADTAGRPRPDILFMAEAAGVRLYFRREGVSYVFGRAESDSRSPTSSLAVARTPADSSAIAALLETNVRLHRLDVLFAGARHAVRVTAEEERPEQYSFYYPHCPRGITGVRAYRRITYHDLYPDVDVAFYTNGGGLKYDIIVRPGGSVSALRLEYVGADSVRMMSDGSVRAVTPLGSIIEGCPIAWSTKKNGSEAMLSGASGVDVPVRYRVTGNRLTFETGAYRRGSTLVIDPTLQWSTLAEQGEDTTGEGSVNEGSFNVFYGPAYHNLACDTAGNAIVASSTVNWAWGGEVTRNWDVHIIKVRPDGTRRWVVYFGGSATDAVGSVVTGDDNAIFLGCITGSYDIPITPSAFQRNIGAYGVPDAFLAKFDSTGRLVWDTYYGGPSIEFAPQVALDSAGNVILTGISESTGAVLSTPDAFQTVNPGSFGNYIAKFSPSGVRRWGTYFGQAAIVDEFAAICVDPDGNIYVAGTTFPYGFPITVKLFPDIAPYWECGYIAKLDPDGGFLWGTVIGASQEAFDNAVWRGTSVEGIAFDRDSSLYLLGNTYARNFPFTRGVVGRTSGRTDSTTFLMKVSTSGGLVWSVGLGGSYWILGQAIAVDTAHNITICGSTTDKDFPVTADATQRELKGEWDAFLAQFDSAGNYLSGSLFGGRGMDEASGVCTWGNVLYITGYTYSRDFPVTPNAFERNNQGIAPFLAKFCNLTIPIGIDGPKALCAGNMTLLSAPPGFDSYHWSTGETTQSIVGRAGGRYWLDADRYGCIFHSDTLAIAVAPPPSPKIVAEGPVRFCAGGSVTLDAGAGYPAYRWSTGDTTRKILVTSAGSYTVEVTDSIGCTGASTPFDVKVDPVPEAAIIVAEGSLHLCQGESVMLMANPAGARYRWLNGSTNRSLITTTAGEYRVIVTSDLGCEDTSDAVTVTVDPRPEPSIAGPASVCPGSTISYNVTDHAGDSYLWSASGGSIVSGQGTSSVTVQWGSGGAASIAVVERTPGGCADSTSLSVTVGDHLVPVVTPAGAVTLCEGSSLTLDAGAGYISYLWSTGQTTRTIEVNAAGSYDVTVGDANGCSGTSAPVTVTVKPSPTVAITPAGPIDLCEGDSVLLTATPGAAGYLWSTGQSTPSIVVHSGGNYSVTATSDNGCTGTSSVTVKLLPAPARPVITAAGDVLTSSEGEGYRWSRDRQPIAGATSRTYNVDRPGSYTVTIDSGGCSATSDPWVRVSQPGAWLDTVSAAVGDRMQLTLHIAPALRIGDRAGGYHVVLKLPVRGLFPYRVIDPRSGAPAVMTYEADGLLTIDRHGLSDPITGDRLLSLEMEGLSTAEPLSPVDIQSVELEGVGQLPVIGEGLVILSGCDVGTNIGFGKRITILAVQPNPVKSAAVVTYRAPKGAMPVLSLLDVAGRERLLRRLEPGTGEEQSAAVEITGVASGIYRLELRDGAERVSVPIIVVK